MTLSPMNLFCRGLGTSLATAWKLSGNIKMSNGNDFNILTCYSVVLNKKVNIL